MTDADVDGSHIRTLLLTFFYRQMPELLERGYIFTAQPPLYKLKKGKQEMYIRDEKELNEHLLSDLLDETKLLVNKKGESIRGQALAKLIEQNEKVQNIISSLTFQYPNELLQSMMYVKRLSDLKNEKLVKEWSAKLKKKLRNKEKNKIKTRKKPQKRQQNQRNRLNLLERTLVRKLNHGYGKLKSTPRTKPSGILQ